MRKKVLALILMLTLALSLMACSDNGKSVESKKTVDKSTDETANEATDDNTVDEIV